MGLPSLLLVILCGINVIAGVSMASVAIWILTDGVWFSPVIGGQLLVTGCVFLLIGGMVVLATAVIGFIALYRHHHVLSFVFLVMLICLFLLYFIGAIMAVVFQDEVESTIQESMSKTIVKYGSSGESDTTESWDRLQKQFRCCAVTHSGWKLYRETIFYKEQDDIKNGLANRKYVPPSCCVYLDHSGEYTNLHRCQSFQFGPPGNVIADLRNEYLFYQGCYEASKEFLKGHAWLLVGLGFALALVMIAEIGLAIIFIRRLKAEKSQK